MSEMLFSPTARSTIELKIVAHEGNKLNDRVNNFFGKRFFLFCSLVECSHVTLERLPGIGGVGDVSEPGIRRRREIRIVALAAAATPLAAVAAHIAQITGGARWR